MTNADPSQAGLCGSTQIGALRLGAQASYGSMQIETCRSIAVLGRGLAADYLAEVLCGRLQAANDLFGSNGFAFALLRRAADPERPDARPQREQCDDG
ncbi:hypothetical protein [Bosea massiliensis]|jgi:hypothetical protein|uniref:Uncharacterized protein n=1 Tax=Bosea massiliensis TaxID=151419 RepID=A0ABW0NUR1_9HYPH